MFPVTQPIAGWILILASFVVFAASFVVRTVIRRRRDDERVRRMLGGIRNSALSRVLFGEPADEMTDEELDSMALMPGLMLAAVVFLGGLALVVMDSFGVELNLFRLPG